MTEQHPITPPDDLLSEFYEFTMFSDSHCVEASGSAPLLSQAIKEGMRYLAQYSQDGHYTLEVRRVKLILKLSLEQLMACALEATDG